MIKSILVASTVALSIILFAGGPPSKGTPPDGRLEANKKPATSKPKKSKKTLPFSSQGPKQPPKKG
jgi:hypothetical protein